MGDLAESNVETESQPKEQPMPSSEEQEATLKKKYGGVIPKKPPLISKDHERAYFDSADWALGKQGKTPGQKPKTMVEALRPKLQAWIVGYTEHLVILVQPTPHQPLPSRRASYASTDGEEGDGEVAASEEAT